MCVRAQEFDFCVILSTGTSSQTVHLGESSKNNIQDVTGVFRILYYNVHIKYVL